MREWVGATEEGHLLRTSTLRRPQASHATGSGHTTSQRADDGGCGDGGTGLERGAITGRTEDMSNVQ